MQRFKVRYARTVIMETVIERPDEDAVVDDGSLPGVYPDGFMPPAHVVDIQDDENVWSVTPEPA